jgi:hypothetical protein
MHFGSLRFCRKYLRGQTTSFAKSALKSFNKRASFRIFHTRLKGFTWSDLRNVWLYCPRTLMSTWYQKVFQKICKREWILRNWTHWKRHKRIKCFPSQLQSKKGQKVAERAWGWWLLFRYWTECNLGFDYF